MSKKTDETSCFIVANEKLDHTKRPCTNLFDKDANTIIDSLKNTAVYQNKVENILVFNDLHISIRVPKNLYPLKYFTQCIFSPTSITQNWESAPHFTLLANNPSMANYFKIKFFDQQNSIFRDSINSGNSISSLTCDIAINIPAELESKSVINSNHDFSEAIKKSLGDQKWENIINQLANQINVSPSRLVLRHKYKNTNEILFPFSPIAPVFSEIFRPESYQFNHCFTYSVISERIKFDDSQVSVSLADNEISRLLTSLSPKNLNENTTSRLSALQEDIFNLLSKKDFIGFLPELLSRICQELSTGELDQMLISGIKNVLSLSLVSIFSPFVSSILKRNVFRFTTWNVFVKWLTSFRNPSIFDFTLDVDNYARETVSTLLGLAIATHEDFVDQCVDICHSFITFFSENHLFSQCFSLMGPVLVAASVTIEKEELLLILTRGFIYLLSIDNQPKDSIKEFTALPHMFKLGSKSNVVCALPISQWEFLPIVSSTVGCFSGPKMIKVNFTTNNAENDILSFWLYFTLAKIEINKQIIDLPILQKAKIRLSYPFEMNNFLISSTVTVLNHTWSTVFPMDQVMDSIKENSKNMSVFPSSRKTVIPNSFIGETQIQACSQSFESRSLSSAIQFLRTNTFLREDDGKIQIADLILSRHMVHCALNDIFFCYNSETLFSILLLFRLSDFTYSIMIRSIDLLSLQLDTFHISLSQFTINNTPLLHFASLTCNDPKFVQSIAKKSYLSIQDSEGMTALFYALRNPNLSICQTLIEEKIDIDMCNNKGISPLIYCIENNDYKRAEFLLCNGASVNKSMQSSAIWYQSALLYVINKKNEKAAKLLLSHSGEEINAPFFQGSFITHQCILMDFTSILYKAYLYSPQFDPNLFSDAFPHPLHYLIQLKTEKKINECDDDNQLDQILKNLLSIPNLDLNCLDDKGDTPLIKAIEKDCDKIANALIVDQRCDVDMLGAKGETPLCLAITKDKINIVKSLLTANAIINMPNVNGKSPLCIAVEKNDKAMVKLLLDNGALPNQWYFGGTLPVNNAEPTIRDILLKKGANEDYPNFNAYNQNA